MSRERYRRTNEQEVRHRQAELQFARVLESVIPQSESWFRRHINTVLHRWRRQPWGGDAIFDLDGNELFDEDVDRLFRKESVLENEAKSLVEGLGLRELLQRYPGIGSDLEIAKENLIRINPRLRECLIVLADRTAEPQALLEWLSVRHREALPGLGHNLGELKATMTQACGLVTDAYVAKNLGPVLGAGFRPPVLR